MNDFYERDSYDLPCHRFYKKPAPVQKKWVLGFFGATAFGVCVLVLLTILTGFYPLLILVVLWLLVMAPLVDTPTGRKSGNLIYFAPLFLVEKPKKQQMRLHGGTLFDYLFVLDFSMTVGERKRLILANYLVGLARLIEAFERGDLDDLLLCGTSHVVGERTLEKLGFVTRRLEGWQSVLLTLNFLTLTASESLANGRLKWPRLGKMRSFEARLSTLAGQRDNLDRLIRRLAPEPWPERME